MKSGGHRKVTGRSIDRESNQSRQPRSRWMVFASLTYNGREFNAEATVDKADETVDHAHERRLAMRVTNSKAASGRGELHNSLGMAAMTRSHRTCFFRVFSEICAHAKGATCGGRPECKCQCLPVFPRGMAGPALLAFGGSLSFAYSLFSASLKVAISSEGVSFLS